MAMYISLVQFTDKGIQAAKQDEPASGGVLQRQGPVQGCVSKQMYWTLGHYDPGVHLRGAGRRDGGQRVTRGGHARDNIAHRQCVLSRPRDGAAFWARCRSGGAVGGQTRDRARDTERRGQRPRIEATDSLNYSAYVATRSAKAFASGRRAKVNRGNAGFHLPAPVAAGSISPLHRYLVAAIACARAKKCRFGGKHEKGERDQFTQEIGLCSVGISVGDETAKASGMVSYFSWLRRSFLRYYSNELPGN